MIPAEDHPFLTETKMPPLWVGFQLPRILGAEKGLSRVGEN